MRIALFSEYYLPLHGGIELHVHALAQQLQQAGHDVTVITPYPGPTTVNGVRVVRLNLPLLPRIHTVFTPKGIIPFQRRIDGGEFDLLHCHYSIYNPATAAASYMAQRAGVPTVVTFHSVLNGYTKGLKLLDSLTGWSKWRAVFTAVNEQIAETVEGVIRRPVHFLPNGFDASHWPPVTKTVSLDFRVTSTLRLARRKRPLALIEMLALLRYRLPPAMQLRARLIGDGKQRAVVERAIARFKLEDVVELCGHLSHERIRAVYADTDVFVLPTLEESFGIAALEARASGLPVVAMAGTGAVGFVINGENGVLAKSDAEMTAALIELARSPALRSKFETYNRTHAPAFQWQEVLNRHLEIYEMASTSSARAVDLRQRAP